MNAGFWHDRAVFLTGHTGFKGGWLSLWLQGLGARLSGYSLSAPTSPSLFVEARVAEGMTHHEGDIRDLDGLKSRLASAQPEIVFHMAAQALVRQGYREPLDTLSSNVLGTANLLEAVRDIPSVKAVVVVTSDKCYENRERPMPYRENEALGGRDPYSASKACAEIVTGAWRDSFLKEQGIMVASARAGNVIGGGDWAADRLVPDALRAWGQGEPLQVRNPDAVRPWQHVLEPLAGYLLLAERLHEGKAAEAWNFGPADSDAHSVKGLLNRLATHWGTDAVWRSETTEHPHEAGLLLLDSSKARKELHWQPRYDLDQALQLTVDWHRAWLDGSDMRAITLQQIARYMSS